MFRFYLLLGFASLCVAQPSVKLEYLSNNELDITVADENQRLLSFTIGNQENSFSLTMHFKNQCFFKRSNDTPLFPLTSLKMRFADDHYSKDIWEWIRATSQNDCENDFVILFPKEIYPKDFYEIELLGSWGDGGNKLLSGTYSEQVFLTISPILSH